MSGPGLAGAPAAAAGEESETGAPTRAALAALDPAARRAALRYELVRRAAAALELPAAQIDPGRPLTALGLDSLAAVELKNALEADLGVAPSLARLLDGASAADLAAELAAALTAGVEAGDGDGEAPSAALSGSGAPVLSFGQRSLWFLARMAPESPAYLIAGAARALTRIDPSALRRSLEALVARHDALRTTIALGASGEPVARVDPRGALDWSEEDASGWSEERLAARLAEEAWRPFDLAAGPLLRAALLRGAPGGDRLVLAVHHVAADLWSLEVLLAELAVLYRGGGRAELPPLPLLYADFARRQAERMAGPRGERLWEPWRDALRGRDGGLPRLALPADRPRPRTQSFRGAAVPVPLPAGLAASLRTLGRERGATLFATLLAGFEVLLARWSGQEELLVGTPTSGRGERGDLAGLVGYFVNPVALRADLAGDPSFEEHLDRTRTAALAAFAHAEYPFPLLAERLQPERDPGRSPVFQVMFALERARGPLRGLAALALQQPGVRLDLGELALESVPLPVTASQFDVTLGVAELGEAGGGDLAARLIYSTDLFDPATAGRMAGHLARLLAAAAAAPSAPVWELPLLSDEEREELTSFNPAAGPAGLPAASRTVHSLFEARARERPESTAVADASGPCTYGEIDAAANRLARRLRRLGVGPEVSVGLLLDVGLESGAERVVALLAVLKAGGAYLSLDPSHPPERLARMLADARCAVLVTRGEPVPELAAAGALVLRLDLEMERIAAEPPEPLESLAAPENLAYLIYTSGSTGEPKGIAVAHASLANLLACHLRLFPAGPQDRTSWFAGPAFDASVWEIWFALAAGAEVHVPPRGLLADPPRLAAWLDAEGITQVFLPTPVAELLFSLAAEDDGAPARPACLRRLFVGGARLRRRPPAAASYEVVDCYGPAEATVISVWARVPPGGAEAGPAPIGRPVDNLRAHVLGRRLQPVPRGAVGELYLAGAGLARGYLGRPELTAERFLPDPFGGEPGGRLYATGDLARHLPGGELDCLGRADAQVKVRGVRVEPGEVESALARHPAVRQAVVVAREDGAGGHCLVAYAVPAGEAPPAEELRAFLRESLPEAMVPSRLVFLPELPLTANGKPDRAALPAPPAGGEEAGFVPPATEVEEMLAGIWREVLRRERVGVYDNFFELGGHSLLVHQVLSRVREGFEVDVALPAFFEAPTIAGLSQAIARELMAQAGEAAVAELLADIDEPPMR